MPYPWIMQRLSADQLNDALGGSTTAWPTFATTTNIVVGTGGSATLRYRKLFGKTYIWAFAAILGSSGFTMPTGPTFTLPFTPHASLATGFTHLGWGTLINAATDHYPCVARLNSGTTVEITAFDGSVAAVKQLGVTATVPFTWGAGDAAVLQGIGEAA